MAAKLDRREFVRRLGAAAIAYPLIANARGVENVVSPSPKKPFRGIFAILQTPFTANDQLDQEDLEREVNFCVRAGAHGLVWPQLAGEFYLLSEIGRASCRERV